MAASYEGGAIRVWEAASGKALATLEAGGKEGEWAGGEARSRESVERLKGAPALAFINNGKMVYNPPSVRLRSLPFAMLPYYRLRCCRIIGRARGAPESAASVSFVSYPNERLTGWVLRRGVPHTRIKPVCARTRINFWYSSEETNRMLYHQADFAQ